MELQRYGIQLYLSYDGLSYNKPQKNAHCRRTPIALPCVGSVEHELEQEVDVDVLVSGGAPHEARVPVVVVAPVEHDLRQLREQPLHVELRNTDCSPPTRTERPPVA